MKILVTGSNGLVGSHFTQNYHPDSESTLLTPSMDELDITNQKLVEDFLNLNNIEVVIHFAAFTDVTAAEQQRNNKSAPCWMVNVEGTTNLIRFLNPETFFVTISTDVVFSGSKKNPGPYSENETPEENPDLLSWYGWTKREAERRILNNIKNFAILRISNPVRSNYESKSDYVRKILNLYDNGKLYPMFNDQYLTLTYINEVTTTLNILLQKRLTGIFHTSSSNLYTPFKLANFLIEKTRGKKNVVKPISINSFLKDNPSRYPQFGGLKVEQTEKKLGIKFRSWEEIIEDLAKQLSALAGQG